MKQTLLLFAGVILAVEASKVLVFTDSNFKEKIKEHELILVEFYAPWCGHCKQLAPEYERAADRLAQNEPPVPLAKVDCIAEKATCKDLDVSGYPGLKIFKAGKFDKDYSGPRDADGIFVAMAKEAGTISKELNDLKEYEHFLSQEGACVVGFFTKTGSKIAKAFHKAAETHDSLRFAHTTAAEILNETKYEDAIVLFRPRVMASKFEETAVQYSGEARASSIKIFLDNVKFGLCPQRTVSNEKKFQKPIFVAYFEIDFTKNPKGSNYWRNRVMKVAKKIREEGYYAHFAVSDKDEFYDEMKDCGLDDYIGEIPAVCAFDAHSRKFKMEEEFSMETFEEFVRGVLHEKLFPYIKSEPIPYTNDLPLKEAVGLNFNQLVNDPKKDVLIEFYAPWCSHCRELAPQYEELAEMLKDEPEVVIAKMDATANDIPTPYEVTGFPTIYFSPKGKNSKPKKFMGSRVKEALLHFVAKEATNELQGYDREGNKKEKKKKKSEL